MLSPLQSLAAICLFGWISAAQAEDSQAYVEQEIAKTLGWIKGRIPTLMAEEILPVLTRQEQKEIQGYRLVTSSGQADSACSTHRDPAFVRLSLTGPILPFVHVTPTTYFKFCKRPTLLSLVASRIS